ncbi:hypothetical protein BGW38_000077 [Lunasporangiospora selenospora]|uniref:Uncharacterized protein n=1 Tax=Lunasporangiospora selenospora TaxID=979761 RepID=A0A9P6FXL2_9FUNG|nr:hypothetical protein BGW38_000077 [Lunasporangiospora selenospora]
MDKWKQDYEGEMRPSGAVLSVLPQECLEIIISHARHDLTTLYNLLLVNRQVFQLTVPVLYHSPFKLAGEALNPPLPSATLTSPQTAHTTVRRPVEEWSQFLRRTKLLTALLICNLRLRPLGNSGRINNKPFWLLDSPIMKSTPICTWDPDDDAAWRPDAFASDDGSQRDSDDYGDDRDDNTQAWDMTWSGSRVRSPVFRRGPLVGTTANFPDLISFDSDLPDVEDNGTKVDATKETGLLMDYFYFYTHHDHRAIGSVIREIFPGAGRREYDRYLAEMEVAILKHNPSQTESIQITSPDITVPFLRSSIHLFGRLSRIELLDAVWSEESLALVNSFLKEHTSLFTGLGEPTGKDAPHTIDCMDDEKLDNEIAQSQSRADEQRIRTRPPTIKHVKYRTNRSYADVARLEDMQFHPTIFFKAIGPGLKTIDTVHWIREGAVDVEDLDVEKLTSLRVCFLSTPYGDSSFSRPEFLNRCRQLRDLELFTRSSELFIWAIQDWNTAKKAKFNMANQSSKFTHLSSRSPLQPHLAETSAPDAKGATGDGAMAWEKTSEARPLVRMRRLRLHAPTDRIMFDLLRDALYGFRDTLQTLDAKTDIVTPDYGSDALHSRIPSSPLGQGPESRSTRPIGTWRDFNLPGVSGQKPHHIPNENDRDAYPDLPSFSSGLLSINWSVPVLTLLDLSGPIAAAFDINSIQFMPRLHSLCLSIAFGSNSGLERRQRLCAGSGPSRLHDWEKALNLTSLPYIAGRSLRRIMLRGPWPEITNSGLRTMLSTQPLFLKGVSCTTRRQLQKNHSQKPLQKMTAVGNDNDGDEDEISGGWGNYLYELTILDNFRVTIQGMVDLARQMDQLQVMGLTLPTPDPGRNPSEDNDILIQRWPILSLDTPAQRSSYDIPTYSQETLTWTGKQNDPLRMAKDTLLNAQLEMPYIDLGPDACHLGRRSRRGEYLSRGWII